MFRHFVERSVEVTIDDILSVCKYWIEDIPTVFICQFVWEEPEAHMRIVPGFKHQYIVAMYTYVPHVRY